MDQNRPNLGQKIIMHENHHQRLESTATNHNVLTSDLSVEPKWRNTPIFAKFGRTIKCEITTLAPLPTGMKWFPQLI